MRFTLEEKIYGLREQGKHSVATFVSAEKNTRKAHKIADANLNRNGYTAILKKRFENKYPYLDWDDVLFLEKVDQGSTSFNASKLRMSIADTRVIEKFARTLKDIS